jgi:hypothetical protein
VKPDPRKVSLTPGEEAIAKAIDRLPDEMRKRLEARAAALSEELFKRYWKAWYSLSLPLSQRKVLHTEFGLPDSHKKFWLREVEQWEKGCAEKRRVKLLSEIDALCARLSPDTRMTASRDFRAALSLAPTATLTALDEEQLRAALQHLRRAKHAAG